MKGLAQVGNVRERSRSARERSKSLRVTSQQLRESLDNLRIYAAEVSEGDFESHGPLHRLPLEYPEEGRRTPLDFAAFMQERVQKARAEARMLRRRAADLRQQAAEFRARSENLRGSSAIL
ncbi:MAG TPA: hypothetical protein VFU27_08640 [Terriglobales bacterium]|nr:hypothetical protein [Terriglobales bacterium]